MAPDVERVRRLTEGDRRVSLATFAIGETPGKWLKEYKNFTGLKAPIYNGNELARKFNITFVPAIVMIAPTDNRAYKKTGQQSFARIYEFYKTVQGDPLEITPNIDALLATPIGEYEHSQVKSLNGGKTVAVTTLINKPQPRVEVERF